MIDLSQLPSPDVVESLDFEVIYQEITAQFASLYPEFDTLLESDPAIKLLELAAYREVQLRARINDAARAVMLAYATNADLTHLAAPFGVERLMTDPGAPSANPPIPPTYESDASLRRRAQLAPESYTSCGTFEAYRFHALSVAGVADAAVLRPEPGVVRVVLLATDGDGTPATELLQAAGAHLSARDRRSVNDAVEVAPATVRRFDIRASLTLYPGPSAGPVLDAARNAAQAYAQSIHRLGYDATLSGIYAALHQPGVMRVELHAPLTDLTCDDTQAPLLSELSLSVQEGADV
ncbi:baseplate assembly protein [Marinobacter sp.]|uniref:baseplate assembly protein n=1 Tax=Marinobacter sp. TaxID=50741 RepID=UPI003A8F5F33